MIDFNSNLLSFFLVISLLLVRQLDCSTTATSRSSLEESKNETLNNNEIGDNVPLDKYKVSKELKYFLNAFSEDNLKNKSIDQKIHHQNSSIIQLNKNSSSFAILDKSTNGSNAAADTFSSKRQLIDESATNFTKLGDQSKNQTTSPLEEKEHLFKSMCSLTSNEIQGCERYECNKNSCYCNDAFDLTVNLKSNWPIKYMCLNKVNYYEDCLVDEQCAGKHQVCFNKKNFRNYLNYDLDVSLLDSKIESLMKTTNSTAEFNRQLFIQQMSTLYDQTNLKEYRGKCKCKPGYFFDYYLSYFNKNKHFNKQFRSLINSSDIGDLFAEQKNLLIGHCLKIRKLNETCELNSECQRNDPSSVCRRSKCVCKGGYQIEIRNQSDLEEDQANTKNSSSVLLDKLINSTPTTPIETKLVCEQILNLNLELGHHHHQVDKNLPFNHNAQMIKNLLNKNCSDEIIICEGSRHNCVKKSKRLHVQENFASLVWTVLCMLSIMLVLCMLLVKNKQDDSLELNHNYNNYFLRESSVNNLNQQTTSFLGSMFNRSHSANATELQNINERNLISCTPPPQFNEVAFNEVIDDPPSYAEAVRLMQQKPGSIRDI